MSTAEQIIRGDLQPVRIHSIQAGALRAFYDIGLETNHVFALGTIVFRINHHYLD